MKNQFYFTGETALKVIEAFKKKHDRIDLSLDLNQTTQSLKMSPERLFLPGGQSIDIKLLKAVLDRNNIVYVFKNQELKPLEIRSDGFYKLVPTATAPTLEINGIKMHRSKDIDPMEDARLKTALVVKSNDLVLDTCGGLGYSSLWAVNAGAKKVVSTEINHSVLKLREQNPWVPAFDRIELIHIDIKEQIFKFEDGAFDSIIHDPPRFSSATGDLYGKPFYTQLFRVLKHQGQLFHYTGSPKRIKEKDRFLNNTKKRLEQCGFSNILFKEHLQGFYAQKNIR